MPFMVYRRAPHGVQCGCRCYDLEGYSGSEWWKVVIMFALQFKFWYWTLRDVVTLRILLISPSEFVKVLNRVLLDR